MYYVFTVSVIRILRKYWMGIIHSRLTGVCEWSVSSDVGAFGEIAPPRRCVGEATFAAGIRDVAR